MTVLPFKAKGTSPMGLSRDLQMGIILDEPGGPSVLTEFFQEGVREDSRTRMEGRRNAEAGGRR